MGDLKGVGGDMTEQTALATAQVVQLSGKSDGGSGSGSGRGLASPFSNMGAFEGAQRMAKALADSSLLPEAYRRNIPNCLIAMEFASRIGVSVLAAMQNLHVIHGNPTWKSQFLIATVNASGRFTPLRFVWEGAKGKPDWGCRAVARDHASGEVCEGPLVTWQMAIDEDWVGRKGSKWKTMPEVMFGYRAAAFWTRLFCPEISLGFQTEDEVHDIGTTPNGVSVALPEVLTPSGPKALEAVLGISSERPNGSVLTVPDEGAAAAAGMLSGLLFNGQIDRSLAGKPVESVSSEQRAGYIATLRQSIADLEENQPDGWEKRVRARADHLHAVASLHEQLRAEEEAPESLG